MDIGQEFPEIEKVASIFAVDPFFLAAIRVVENGKPGREFGVLSVPAPAYADQLTVCAKSVRNRLAEYSGNPLELLPTSKGSRRLVYSSDFLHSFSARWAPSGAKNDPHNLNANWFGNCRLWYHRFATQGKVA